VRNLINSVKFLCNNAYTEILVATLRPWFRGLNLGLGLQICGLDLEHVGLGLDTSDLILITVLNAFKAVV